MMRFLLLILLFFSINFSSAQYKIEDQKLELVNELIKLKSQLIADYQLKSTYKIQLFSGSLKGAKEADKRYQEGKFIYPALVYYETPNYKLWVGDFNSKLEADRAYIEVKELFPNAFVFKPGR